MEYTTRGYLDGVNLTLPYEVELANAYSQLRCRAISDLFADITALADDGILPYPVELIEVYADDTVVAFDEDRNMIKYVMCGEEDKDGSEYRFYGYVEVYLISDDGTWIHLHMPQPRCP